MGDVIPDTDDSKTKPEKDSIETPKIESEAGKLDEVVSKKEESPKAEKLLKSRGSLRDITKPNVSYDIAQTEERKKWAFAMSEKLPMPKAGDVSSWNAQQIGDFVEQIPIFGLNEFYAQEFRKNGVTGKMFLNCNEETLTKWGIDRRCHRARFRAEALSMKRRG